MNLRNGDEPGVCLVDPSADGRPNQLVLAGRSRSTACGGA